MEKKVIINILAGGKGTRIGGNKPLFIYENKPLIEHVINRLKNQCDEIIISLGFGQNQIIYDKYHKIYDDKKFENFGPMAGVLSGLLYAISKNADYIIAPCDCPKLPNNYSQNLLSFAKKNQNKIIYYKGLRDYPLCGFIPHCAQAPLYDALLNCQNGLKVLKFMNEFGALTIDIENEDEFININHPPVNDIGRLGT